MKRNLQSDEDSYGEGEHKTEDEKFSGFSDVSPTSTKSITNENINNQTSNGSDDKVIILDVGGAIKQVHTKPIEENRSDETGRYPRCPRPMSHDGGLLKMLEGHSLMDDSTALREALLNPEHLKRTSFL